MPNAPRPENRHRMVRVEDDLWRAAGAAAAAESTTRSEIMRQSLAELVARHGEARTAPGCTCIVGICSEGGECCESPHCPAALSDSLERQEAEQHP